MPTTDLHNLNVPTEDARNWDELLNENFESIDETMVVRGSLANRPSPGNNGRLYLAPGTHEIAYDFGDQWEPIASIDRSTPIPLQTISDTNSAVGLRKRIPSGMTLRIEEMAVQDSTGSAPSGLTVEVYDDTNASSIVSRNALYDEGEPLATKDGAIDVIFRVTNNTGGSIDASGEIRWKLF